MPPIIHVVAGIVFNAQGEILLSSRPKGKEYAGYWEFAGGKIEPNETPLSALQREFKEELDINILNATPWLAKFYRYPHAHVHLRFFRITAHQWRGKPTAKEQQQFIWQHPSNLTVSPMLPANTALLHALTFPQQFSGNLKTGLQGENQFFIAPFSSNQHTQPNVMMTPSQWQQIGRLPEKNSVWLIIENAQQFHAADHADAIIWHVTHVVQATEVLQHLQTGAPIPIAIATTSNLYKDFAQQWKNAGAQAVFINP